MPEGDTIVRAARALHEALAGRAVTRFESVFPRLTRVDAAAPLRGRTIEAVQARGKHLLIWFSGDLVLRTHMRMHGSWHLYKPGERWQQPGADMRIVIGTADYEAVAFRVPVAELGDAQSLERDPAVRALGPDVLSDDFDPVAAARRIAQFPDVDIADALLDQSNIAGIGNIFKSESLFAAKVDPFAPAGDLSPADIERVVRAAQALMRASVANGRMRQRAVYGRTGQLCRRCGTRIRSRKQGPDARVTYWCERCQRATSSSRSVPDRG